MAFLKSNNKHNPRWTTCTKFQKS